MQNWFENIVGLMVKYVAIRLMTIVCLITLAIENTRPTKPLFLGPSPNEALSSITKNEIQ